ncbi:MAG TPA: sigma-70 family RNA polymerase sigma factor [Anaerolineales bacterium]|nr:sigma-70 family RNA polymerase sigma factor [Anaerolineales bacterium]
MEVSFSVEQDILRRAASGDEDAFEELIEAFSPALYRVVRRMAASSGLAEEIVQETFWRVWQALPRYRADRRFFPYLATIAANLVRDEWRKDRRLAREDLEDLPELASDQPPPEKQVEAAELMEKLARSVKDLPPLCRAVIALRYDAGMSYEDIASALDLPINTVRTYLHRAKSKLQVLLEEAYG